MSTFLFDKSGRAVAQRRPWDGETVFDSPACSSCFTGVLNEGAIHGAEKIKYGGR